MSRPAPKPHTLADARAALALIQTPPHPDRTEDSMPSTTPELQATPAPRDKTHAQITAEARSRVEARRAADEDALYRAFYPNPND